ncbi:MarR family winged helix-turn-helix transcriptional regulator [Paraburkholderia silvatlantica]|uniref:DNA-binding MarR family transcriptional regulator n=1 Tax=Paraburkholderia silvatlantica TaxID=321895 RepID=A0ABR6FII5_9BURK|nr:MarR family winged helix-turn-helix transcriptional regulator [Paraburkholderia silvatlantica]MBB2926595.1 DNA-binding MarR family transcriptional regulator [Paraburkholderia silvatlantica]PVY37767.1 DNA-binding MarR family transcriptional regulator [Paraburkholderia silvatlantica]PXW42731.1 DNA-binding MarR family transcriptional regulator [Paraburkholderia silvatlantica]
MRVNPEVLKDFFESRTLGSPDAAIGFVLWRLVHRFQREMNRALDEANLTHLQFTTLALVAWSNRSGEPVSQAELSRAAEIEPMQMSQMMNVLEAKGFIVRHAGKPHPRAKSASITPAGLDALESAMAIAIDVQKRVFGKSGSPGGDLLTIVQAL